MALFEVTPDRGLIAFRTIRSGAELYESQLEDLLWDNLEELTGDPLFPVRRQAPIRGGGRPDIVCLDRTGAVVVIEVKRAIDRSQLAQCLEYAGWARSTNLDELAKFYHRGSARFWDDWTEFTGTTDPVLVNRNPSLIVTAGSFDDRSGSAVQFLVDNGLPIKVITTTMYQDSTGRRFLDTDIQGDSLGGTSTPVGTGLDGAVPAPTVTRPGVSTRRPTRTVFPVSLLDLIAAGKLPAGERLTWHRPRSGDTHVCTVQGDGSLQTADGRSFSSLSSAATHAAGGGSFDGWEVWRSPTAGGMTLKDIRTEFLREQSAPDRAVNQDPTADR